MHAVAWRCGDRIEGRVGLNAVWVADRERPGAQDPGGDATAPEPVCVILDDTASAEAYWEPDPRAHHCAMSVVVHEIARWVHAEGGDLLVSFVGLDQVFPVDRGATLATIERSLQDVRRSEDPSSRGWYVAPVRDALGRQHVRPVRPVLIGDAPVLDLGDCRRDGGIELERLWLSRQTPVVAAAEEAGRNGRVLFPDSAPDAGREPSALRRRLDAAVIESCFARTAGLDRVAIQTSDAPPVQWRPTSGVLSRHGGAYRLGWHLGGARAGVLHARFLAGAPAALTFHLQRRDRDAVTVSVPCETTPGPSARADRWSEPCASGILPQSERAHWARLCDQARPCDVCGRVGGHLLHRGAAHLYGHPILRSHAALPAGWLCQRAGAPDWHWFDTGIELDGVGGALVVLDRQPHRLVTAGPGSNATTMRVEPLEPHDDDEFVLAAGGVTWHVARLVNGASVATERP